MMLETSVPLCMRTARQEFIFALGARNEEEAEKFRRRANRTMRRALREIGRDRDCDYDWTLLRPSPQDAGNA
jgi:hypothetical protein